MICQQCGQEQVGASFLCRKSKYTDARHKWIDKTPQKTFVGVETFICQLIDNCEGEIVTEEFLQREYAAFLKLHN